MTFNLLEVKNGPNNKENIFITDRYFCSNRAGHQMVQVCYTLQINFVSNSKNHYPVT